MGGKDSNFQIVYRGNSLKHYVEGGWVFFQRPKECGGGYWFGRTYSDCFWFEFAYPTSLNLGMQYIASMGSFDYTEFDDDFKLEG